jgi:thiol-disulfide isomerase/thioredoxin
MVPTGTWKTRFSGNRMLKPLLANVVLASLLTMPGCGKNDVPPDAPGGYPAPEIQALDLDGKPFKLSDFRGKVVDLSFWASWCPPCRGLIPHERSLIEKYRDRPFVLIGVNGDDSPNDGAHASLKLDAPWRSFWDGRSGPIAEKYAIEGWPTSFIIDANGIVRDKILGPDRDRIDRVIAKLVAEAESKSGR